MPVLPRAWTAALTLALLAALLPSPSTTLAAPAPLEAPASNEAWARALVAALPRATAVNDADGNKLFDDLDRAYLAAAGARVPVVVSFVAGTATEDGVARVRAVAPEASVTREFRIIPAYAGALRLHEALRVAALPEVRQVELDRAGRPELDTATAFMGADVVVDGMGITGSLDGMEGNFTREDVTIAILDTGFDGKHVDLGEGKLVAFVDLGDGKTEPYDEDGHGTHVASIAAGLGRGDPEFRGVAPGAGVVGIKIVGKEESSLSLAIEAYEWLVEHKDERNIRVATMSFGFGLATDGTTALERAVDAAWDAGIVCFKSNGNSGPGRGTMTVPAAARGILGVGSMLDPAPATSGLLPLGGFGGFSLSGFSSRGPTADGRVKPDLVAPGQSINAAEMGTKDQYVAFSGTSMAAPFAAGTAALMLAANPSLAPDDVRRVLAATAEDWGIEGPDVDYGHGRIRVDLAVREALRLAGLAPPDGAGAPVVPFHEVRAGVVRDAPFEGAIEVNDTAHPIAGTFIAEGLILGIEIRAPDDAVVGRLTAPLPARQQSLGFQPTTPGTYAFRVVAASGTPFVADFSHGTAPPLVDLPVVVGLEGAEGLVPAAGFEPGAQVPAPGALLALAALALAGTLLRRRG